MFSVLKGPYCGPLACGMDHARHPRSVQGTIKMRSDTCLGTKIVALILCCEAWQATLTMMSGLAATTARSPEKSVGQPVIAWLLQQLGLSPLYPNKHGYCHAFAGQASCRL